jgi:hypothetical protein
MKPLIILGIGLLLCWLFVGTTMPAHTGPNPDYASVLWFWVPGCLLILGATYFIFRKGKKK